MTKQCLRDMKCSFHLEWLNTARKRRNKNVARVYIFISPYVCTGKRRWTFPVGKVHKYSCDYSKSFQDIFLFFCSIPLLSMCFYPQDNSKGHLTGSLNAGWLGAPPRKLLCHGEVTLVTFPLPSAGTRLFLPQPAGCFWTPRLPTKKMGT